MISEKNTLYSDKFHNYSGQIETECLISGLIPLYHANLP